MVGRRAALRRVFGLGMVAMACMCGTAEAVDRPVIAGVSLPDLTPEAAAVLRREKRVALVMGNQGYRIPSFRLTKTRRDAEAMAALLRYLGFEVILAEDTGKTEMMAALDRFQAKLAGGVDIGLFFYSGHGQQNSLGRGYILPTDVPERLGDANLQEYALAVEYIRNRMLEGRARLNILALDACRNNPGVMGMMSPVAKGLGSPLPAVANAGSDGMVIAYATEAGHLSSEGDERNPYSVYTAHLLLALATPGVTIEQAFALASKAVGKSTRGAQRPQYTAGVYDDFQMIPTMPSVATLTPMTTDEAWAMVLSGNSSPQSTVTLARSPAREYHPPTGPLDPQTTQQFWAAMARQWGLETGP